jgi:hypothetical protein
VAGVTDGDTLSVEVDGTLERVRLIGIDAPEHGECLADVASERLTELLSGGKVRLETDTTDRDRYGRLLRYQHGPLDHRPDRMGSQGRVRVAPLRVPRPLRTAGGGRVRVASGCGTDRADHLHWCMSNSAVWNNSGDTAFLLDPNGNIFDTYRYDATGSRR